ncbi:beta-xylosidase [Rhodopirellula rubra]|uniref:Beta-xylosidase n=1 Tax=Aporhodopirellula rubra TaxID=980271 RepID=A0A7W5H7P6_9BACT|nr:family 43 glycosylhydrolase [Aporhodopirellula rubra]MBB3208270.1 beta-xylosidase [Aporhodopirellula rubra]
MMSTLETASVLTKCDSNTPWWGLVVSSIFFAFSIPAVATEPSVLGYERQGQDPADLSGRLIVPMVHSRAALPRTYTEQPQSSTNEAMRLYGSSVLLQLPQQTTERGTLETRLVIQNQRRLQDGSGTETDRMQETYVNPVIAGDIPDPTIIRVGEIYYAAGTSCDFAPHYPLYESSDLINWERIGSVFRDTPNWASDDFWAPELFYRDGTFYVYYTTKRKDNRIACIGVATTKDIRQGFTDHGIIIEWGEEAIDAFVFDDDDGKRYITWKAYGLTDGRPIEILGSELSEDGLSLLGDAFTLTDHSRGWQGAGDEGQCLVKHEGYYYLFYSIGGCCDNRCDYRVKVSRSKNLKFGWEQLPDPILSGGKEWKCPGHGTLVTTADNRHFYLYHAYHATDFEFIGRQGMLDEVEWDAETGWPHFKNGSTPSARAELPFKKTEQKRATVWEADFTSDKNLAFLEWDTNHSKPSIEVANGQLRIKPSDNEIAFVGLRPSTGNYSVQAEVLQGDGMSGIGLYSNQQNYLALMIDRAELILARTKDGTTQVLSKQIIGDRKSLLLRYEAVGGRNCQFSWSENGADWSLINVNNGNPIDANSIIQWGSSPRAGLMTKTQNNSILAFQSLRIEYDFREQPDQRE